MPVLIGLGTVSTLASCLHCQYIMNASAADRWEDETVETPTLTDAQMLKAYRAANPTTKGATMKTRIASMIATTVILFSAIAMGAEAMKPVATCNDGKVFSSVTGDHRGACSGHGGVAKWADGSPVKSHGKKTSYK